MAHREFLLTEQGEEGRELPTNHSSWHSVHKGSQDGTLQSVRKFIASWCLGDLLKFGCGQDPPIRNTMPKSSCTMVCFLGSYAIGVTIAFLVAVTVCVITWYMPRDLKLELI